MHIKLNQFILILTLVFISKEINAGTIINTSTSINQSLLNSYSWPVTINGGTNGSPVVITLDEDVILSNSQNYFILNGDYINFNGNNHKITISGINFYSGLIKNGSYESSWVQDPNDEFNYIQQITTVNGFSNINILNLTVNSINSDVAGGAGWIGQKAFSINATNGLFENCSSNGPIRQGSGGIVGGRTSVTVKNSAFFGNHIGGYAGGIFGETSSGTAINCYSMASSLGNRGGGIFGGDSLNATATNCYSFSTIVDNAGGIFGGYSSNCNASNCYSLGTIGSNAGGVYGGNSSGGSATNCYSANGNWDNVTANSILTGTNGTIWNTISSPYKLISFATIITTNTTIDQIWIDNHINNLPILLNANVTITIAENLIFNDANMYFAIRGTGVTIEGNGKTITLNGITNYSGLVNNGDYLGQSGIAGYAGSVVRNIGVISNNSSLKEYCGWIGQRGYGNGAGFSITNCYSTGDMTNNGTGGILGNAFMNGTISNCYSLGNISGESAAGIAATNNSDASKINNCYANGLLTGVNANGICEPPDMMMGDGANFSNCYVSNGTFNTTDANNNLIGTDGTVWNTNVNPYTLSSFTFTWNGTTNTDWNTASNWSLGSVPTSIDDVSIPSGLSNYPIIPASIDVTVNNITIASGASLTKEKTSTLSVSGNFINTGGTVTLNSDSDEFSSLLVSGTTSGDITYNRYVNSVSGGWDLIGSPVSGLPFSTFIQNANIATNGSFYAVGSYDNTNDTWTNATNATSGNLQLGKGYQMATTSGGTLSFTGTIANGNQSVTINNNDATNSGVGRRWNLIANPFASYLYANNNADGTHNFLTVNTAAIDDNFEAIYGWNSTGYTIYNNTSSATYIAPGQGFFVAAAGSGEDQTISFTKAMQTIAGTDDFIASKTLATSYELVLEMHQEAKKLGDTKFYFKEGLKLGLDPGYDAGAFNQGSALSSRLLAQDNGINMGINAMSLDHMNSITVPLVINQEAGTPFAIRIANHTLPSDINVYVEDVVEKTVTLVTAQSFELTPQTKLSGIGRFYLHFTRSSLSVESIVNTSLISAYKGNGNDYISIEGLQLFSKASKIILYNLLGVKIIDTTLNTPSQKEMISTAGIKQGVYILEINYDNQVLTKKIVID